MDDFANRIRKIQHELRDLKTAGLYPSIMAPCSFPASIPAVGRNDPRVNMRIYYKKTDTNEAPCTFFEQRSITGVYLRAYDITNQTQDIRVEYSTAKNIIIYSTREIYAIENSTTPAPPEPIIPPEPEPPTPADEWIQYRNFNPANMGTRAGYCLQNCRLGFGIMTGQFPSARADMNSQRANGTLHTDLPPPANIAVPVYCESGTPNGHVVVWDHGKVYSDGKLIAKGLSAWSTVYGWGELCDGRRVVQHS